MRDLSLHLMDIVQNSIRAKATRIVIEILADIEKDHMKVVIKDNGHGMEEPLVKEVINPFVTTRTNRKVGLGIPLLEASTGRAGGGLIIESEKGRGTCVTATFKISHIDRLPLGDVSETMMNLIAANPELDFELELSNTKERFVFKLSEVKAQLGEIPVDDVEILMWIKEYINEGILEIFGGVLSEIHN
ncbi:MAG: ATP-binding protein [Firmicutes bacterium]|nr:ATP-binding protein [Bacillota bacterium]